MRGANTALTATIANGQTTSDAVNVGVAEYIGFILPAAFTGTGMTFQVSHNGVDFTLHSEASMTVAQGRAYRLPANVAVFPWIRFVSGSAEGGARSIVVTRKR